jgi:hypothetical protein
LRLIRRLDVTWSADEVAEYEHLVKLSKHAKQELPDFVKDVLRKAIEEKPK